ncbi:hypothetical protein [Novosphingobium olei]|uniref:Uncharacterized protein n=1 Tax=Novosphingobium olei TaxID=2728851 RepID=A0A7Y0BR04_9SPHN|nr:hypothetical protein [Novosphingobium olei]NML94967.1 hypothetical protein [Novosphingobium olei]
MAKGKKADDGMKPENVLTVEQTPTETGARAMARKLLQPQLRNAATASTFAMKVLGDDVEKPGIMDFLDHVQKATVKAESGDLAIASAMLASQAVTLDAMFTELARRAAVNMGEYINAAERYGRLALKAQSNCRATLEALAKLHQPREQTVRHVHVNEGGKAVIADQFHHHAGGAENGKVADQSHAAGAAGTSPSLSCPDAFGNGVPIPSRERAEAVPYARGHESGCA